MVLVAYLLNRSVECPQRLEYYETSDDTQVDDPDVLPILFPFTALSIRVITYYISKFSEGFNDLALTNKLIRGSKFFASHLKNLLPYLG